MSIFWGNKNKEKLVLVFDIGSSSVGGSFFYMQKNGVPKIVFAIREPIILEKSLDIDRFLFLTIKSLEIVADKIYKAGIGKPEIIFCILSSSWYISQTRIIRLEKNVPFTFTDKLADSLIQKEISLFEEEHLLKYKNSGNTVRPIELKNIKIMLNGYETSNPLNKKIKELEMTIFISMSSEQILGQIEKTIKRHFHFKEIKFSSFGMASFAVVRDMYINQENFLLIDVNGEITDISMIKKNILRESVSFPVGFNFMIRGVASTLSCSLSEARSYISLYKDNHATESMVKKLDPIINKLKIDWIKKFQESLANITNDISIPATIYIAIDKDLADFFGQIIKNEQFNQYTLTESKFEIIFLGTEIFHRMASFEGNIIRDPGLIIDSIYINRFFN